jgi:glucosamine--fructose-6-phosphate aminotransferase (isomerizing)
VAAKNASPMVIGLGDGENFIASDVTAILAETRKILFIEEGELITITKDAVAITDFEGRPKQREPKIITWSAMQAEKGGFKHFMLKEIHEQPRAVADTLVGRVDLERDDVNLDEVKLDVAASSGSSSSRAAPRTTRRSSASS